MNKLAPKEPSMDEILSSIRQIIADDDAGLAPFKPRVAPPDLHPAPVVVDLELEPLALSAEQIMRDAAVEGDAGPGFAFDEMLEPDGISTRSETPNLMDTDDVAFEPVARQGQSVEYPTRHVQRAAPVAQAAPMPDRSLTTALAEQLLEPTTEAAVRSTLGRITGITTVPSGITVEQLVRDMLRPMLKDWLDENLPLMVERIVEQEIARATRGGL